MRTALLLILALILALGGVLVFGALGLRSDQQALASPAPPEVDSVAMLERFRGGLRIPTISRQPGEGMNDAAFEAFREYLTREYPLIHARLERELVSGHTLLFRWPGRDPSLPAVVLLAHQDVVPVDPGSEGDWLHPPFEAVVDEGFVWARGAMDDKLGLFALIEAVEALLGTGFEPRRTVYIVLGHDEELGGPMGASQVALLLAERRVSVGLVLDEGGAIAEGQIPGMERPVALVGVAEKGYTTLSLEVTSPGGHSSAPPAQTTIGILSAAIARLETQPFPSRLGEVGHAFFERGIGPEGSFGLRLIYGNLWIFEPLLTRVMESAPTTAALIRTTTATTIIEAGTKENVLPTRATALVNFRILPGETGASVLEQARGIVADPRVEMHAAGNSRDPSPPSSLDSVAWSTLDRTIREVFPRAIVAPYLVLGGTDSRYFRPLCDCVYRFLPVHLDADSMRRAHGTNERVPVSSLGEAFVFYRQLILNADAAAL